MDPSGLRNIIYFCIPEPKPTGGIKYLLRHSKFINSMAEFGVASAIHVPNAPTFDPPWGADLVYKKDNVFNRHSDLIVLPEIMVDRTAPTLMKLGMKYAILVQNGYYIARGGQDLDKARQCYHDAAAILSTSDEITICLHSLFPAMPAPIFEVNYAIDPAIFFPRPEKRDLITYMPRKLKHHLEQVRHHLSTRDTRGWTLAPIDGLDEAGVAELLGTSKIFMSFSETEGFGLPPVEAAMSGNKVIGYTGQGGREYWTPPLFEEIPHGDVMAFASAVEREIARQSAHATSVADAFAAPIADLAERYSAANEAQRLESFVRAMVERFR